MAVYKYLSDAWDVQVLDLILEFSLWVSAEDTESGLIFWGVDWGRELTKKIR